MALIQTSFSGHIATIAFDNYPKRNALSFPLIAETIVALDQFKAEEARVVVLRSATNGPVWSAGHDVLELPQAGIDPLPYSDPLEQLLREVKNFPAPVIGMVHGSVWGGACELIMSCDLVYGDESCTFAITAAKLGLPYNVAGLLSFLNRIPLAIAKEMFFSADAISAQRAERVGIVNEVIAEADLEARVYALAATIASRSPLATRASKEAMHVLSEALAINPSTYERLQGLRRDVYFGRDYQEGIRAFIDHRSAEF